MDPKVMIGIGVLALMQLFAAIQVMRAASERPDLTGLGRLIPVLLTLLIPVLGPLIGGRATDAGTRPMLFSLIGTVVCGAMVLLTTPPAAAPAPLQAAAPAPDATAGQPAQPAPDAAAPAEQPQPAAAPRKSRSPQPRLSSRSPPPRLSSRSPPPRLSSRSPPPPRLKSPRNRSWRPRRPRRWPPDRSRTRPSLGSRTPPRCRWRS